MLLALSLSVRLTVCPMCADSVSNNDVRHI